MNLLGKSELLESLKLKAIENDMKLEIYGGEWAIVKGNEYEVQVREDGSNFIFDEFGKFYDINLKNLKGIFIIVS